MVHFSNELLGADDNAVGYLHHGETSDSAHHGHTLTRLSPGPSVRSNEGEGTGDKFLSLHNQEASISDPVGDEYVTEQIDLGK